MLEHMGIRWGYVFLHGAAHINEEEMKDLMIQAVEMYLAGDEEREIKGDGFEGKLYTERKYEVIGALGGQRFDAKLETPQGARPGGVFGERAVAGDGVVYFEELGAANRLRSCPRTQGALLPATEPPAQRRLSVPPSRTSGRTDSLVPGQLKCSSCSEMTG